MNKFIQTIHNLYNKVLPIAQNSGVELNLDYSDPSSLDIDVETDDPELKAELEEELKKAITRTNSGSVKLRVSNGVVTISDTGTVLSRPLCESLSHGRVKVKSRVGFGTSVDISLAKAEDPEKTTAPNADTNKISETAQPSKKVSKIKKLISGKTSKTTKANKSNKPNKTEKEAGKTTKKR